MIFSKNHWRLIETPAASGAWNMALDEALAEFSARGESLPALRLYAWAPPCLSLGYAQPYSDIDEAALQRNGWEVVRRPTGGRAILHCDELTYSVTGPQTEPRLTGGVLESYRVLSAALLQALQYTGLPAQALEKPASGPVNPQNPVCFEAPSNYEITVAGKKLIGSAQSRRREGVLQHGSLPLYGDLSRITWALEFPGEIECQEAAARLLERATTIETILGFTPTWKQAAGAFRIGFAEALNLELIPAEPSPAELERAEELLTEKYANPAWTKRV